MVGGYLCDIPCELEAVQYVARLPALLLPGPSRATLVTESMDWDGEVEMLFLSLSLSMICAGHNCAIADQREIEHRQHVLRKVYAVQRGVMPEL